MTETEDGYRFHIDEPSEWRCELFGSGPHGLTFTPRKGKEPNWFWRTMQYLAFGNRWKRGVTGLEVRPK